jgi:hypothetical protein
MHGDPETVVVRIGSINGVLRTAEVATAARRRADRAGVRI